MRWTTTTAPSLDDFAALAEAALADIPAALREKCGPIELRVMDFPDDDMLDALGIETPFELTGLYEGVDLTQASVNDARAEPDRVFLFRRPILDEWAEAGDIALGDLVAHVLIHEIGHHFGFSDAAMDAILEGEG